jgi:WD40 repeat protein
MNTVYRVTAIALSFVIVPLNAMQTTLEVPTVLETYVSAIPKFTKHTCANEDLIAILPERKLGNINTLTLVSRSTKISQTIYRLKIQESLFTPAKMGLCIDTKSLYMATEENTIVAIDTKTLKPQYALYGHDTYYPGISCVEKNLHKEELASADANRNIKIWDIETQKCIFSNTMKKTIAKIAYSTTSIAAQSQSREAYTRLMDLRNRKIVHRWHEEGYPDSIFYSADGNSVVSCRLAENIMDTHITIYDQRKGMMGIYTIPGTRRPFAVDLYDAEHLAIPATTDNGILLFQPFLTTPAKFLLTHPEAFVAGTGLSNPVYSKSTKELLCQSQDPKQMYVYSFN